MKFTQAILTKNRCYTAGRTIKIRGLMLHSVGCAQPSAAVFVKKWNSTAASACVHAFIDGNTGEVYQTLPWNRRGWHAGGDANGTHVGVEMCEPACIKYTGGSTFTCSDLEEARAVARRTYDSAVELFAHLADAYDLDPLADGVIISHAEGHKRGLASNHGDPEHLWRQLGLPYTMGTFRAAVAAAMADAEPAPKPAPAASFRVRVRIKDLNIRKGPGYKLYSSVGCIPPGVYTILETCRCDGYTWGRLKSGAGWIALEHTEKL